MTCTECEALLGDDPLDPRSSEHLATCEACRFLGHELQANGEVLGALREEVLPQVNFRRPVTMRPWLAAAAAVMLATGLTYSLRTNAVLVPPSPPIVAEEQPLKIKILTPDPDVVIYWLVPAPQGDKK